MKKTYSKPEIEVIDFRLMEDLMGDIIDGSMGNDDEFDF